MADVTLSAAIRSNLLALQNTASLVKQTQSRLSTGLKVGSAVDDPVAYFQGKALTDRASDFGVKKGYIDQGISSLNAATNGIQSVESVVKQMQGLVLSAKSATSAGEITNIISQFNDLRTQVNSLTRDASYQGLNLIAGTGQMLEVSFSNLSGSFLNVNSQDATARGLGINAVGALSSNAVSSNLVGAPKFAFDYVGSNVDTTLGTTGASGAGVTKLTFTVAMTASQVVLKADSTGTSTQIKFKYGTYDVTAQIASTGTTGALYNGQTLTAGQVVTLTIASVASTSGNFAAITTIGAIPTTMKAFDGQSTIGVGMTQSINGLSKQLESALTSVRSIAQTLGSNTALLTTRLDFTTNYMNTLTAGSGKLTLADLNEESANMLALQTRQQLGIQALSMANQAEQGVLGLFR